MLYELDRTTPIGSMVGKYGLMVGVYVSSLTDKKS